jgi:tripartite-type tricarboxylate transporter receptor subunit TctC
MSFPRRQFLRFAAAAAVLPTMSHVGWTQGYPTRQVRVIVPFAPGGPPDTTARLIAAKLSENLNKQFYVENLPGGSGNTGTGQAARATADGYTVLITVNNIVINPPLFEKVPYDPYKDFDPVTLAVSYSSVLAVNPSIEAKTVKELVDLIKANPGKHSYASPGFGTPTHLLGEQLRVALGLDLVHVPYTGSGPATAAIVAGHAPIGFVGLAAAGQFARDGKLRLLAVMSRNPASALPGVPTIAAAGYTGLDGDGWVGALVPTGTPKDIIVQLNAEIGKVVKAPELKERLAQLGLDPVASTPEAFTQQMRAEEEKWAKVIRAGNIKAPQ